MPSDNPLNNDPGQDPKKGDQFNNLNTIQRVQIQGQVHDTSQKFSQPDQNGVYQDTETKFVVNDPAGNVLPESGRPYAISWSWPVYSIARTDGDVQLRGFIRPNLSSNHSRRPRRPAHSRTALSVPDAKPGGPISISGFLSSASAALSVLLRPLASSKQDFYPWKIRIAKLRNCSGS